MICKVSSFKMYRRLRVTTSTPQRPGPSQSAYMKTMHHFQYAQNKIVADGCQDIFPRSQVFQCNARIDESQVSHM